MTRVTRQILDVVCLFLQSLSLRWVPLRNAPYSLLAEDPEKCAKDFAAKFNLAAAGSGKMIYQGIMDAFHKMLPAEPDKRQEAYLDQAKDIAGLAAYCGVMLLATAEGNWKYINMKPKFSDEIISSFVPVLPNLAEIVDPMQVITRAWNLTPYYEENGFHKSTLQRILLAQKQISPDCL